MAKDKTSKKYFVVQTIWHGGQRRHAYPGELVELDHLSEEHIGKWLAANVVAGEAEGQGQFTRSLNIERPPLPPEVVAAALEQAALDPANAQPEPAAKTARKRVRRAGKKGSD